MSMEIINLILLLAAAYLQQLLKLMEKQQPYTNNELTLNQLAEMPSISSHDLSEISSAEPHVNGKCSTKNNCSK
jgi:hypothetical protein